MSTAVQRTELHSTHPNTWRVLQVTCHRHIQKAGDTSLSEGRRRRMTLNKSKHDLAGNYRRQATNERDMRYELHTMSTNSGYKWQTDGTDRLRTYKWDNAVQTPHLIMVENKGTIKERLANWLQLELACELLRYQDGGYASHRHDMVSGKLCSTQAKQKMRKEKVKRVRNFFAGSNIGSRVGHLTVATVSAVGRRATHLIGYL